MLALKCPWVRLARPWASIQPSFAAAHARSRAFSDEFQCRIRRSCWCRIGRKRSNGEMIPAEILTSELDRPEGVRSVIAEYGGSSDADAPPRGGRHTRPPWARHLSFCRGATARSRRSASYFCSIWRRSRSFLRTSVSSTLNSTRRFIAITVTVVLSAIGCFSP